MSTTAITAHSSIAELLSTHASAMVASVQNALRAELKEKNAGLVFLGTGSLGQLALSSARSAGLRVVAFADNDPAKQGTICQGVQTFSPAAAVEQFGRTCIFVITLYRSASAWKQLRGLGIEPISFARLSWLYPEFFLPHCSVALPDRILTDQAKVQATINLWADDESRQEYVQQLTWRTSLCPPVLSPHSPPSDTYFPRDIFSLTNEEVFVDCGACDGDAILGFLNRTDHQFRSILALEPDSLNRERLRHCVQRLPGALQERIEILPYAVGESQGKLRFNETGTVASAMGSGDSIVECVTLDMLLKNTVPTFIKMDIEGAEPFALRGSAKTIRTHAPIMAVCLYHAQEHLWDIPLYLKELVPDYQLFLRRYADECWELVCYAVPSGKCLLDSSAR